MDNYVFMAQSEQIEYKDFIIQKHDILTDEQILEIYLLLGEIFDLDISLSEIELIKKQIGYNEVSGNYWILIYNCKKQIIGLCSTLITMNNQLFFYNLGVQENYRKNGIASKILEIIQDIAGAKVVIFQIMPNRPELVKFYENKGCEYLETDKKTCKLWYQLN
jgi:N-acetylglutamate synthase-like GNAT family acetyltransferase